MLSEREAIMGRKRSTTYSKVSRHLSHSEGGNTYIVSDYELESEIETTFDPNHQRYLCCCGHAHSITGMKIVAGMLCITVLFELWQLVVTLLSIGVLEKVDVNSAAIRFCVGAFIAGSVLWAMMKERAELLLPYLLLQGAGLAIGLVFFVSFVYIALFGDKKVGATVLRSYGFPVKSKDGSGYITWLMVGSMAIIIFLQVWLMCIVVACWRFFRDKRNLIPIFPSRPHGLYGTSKGKEKAKLRVSMSATAFGAFKKSDKDEKGRTRSFSATSEV